jgi:hypothetical protein
LSFFTCVIIKDRKSEKNYFFSLKIENMPQTNPIVQENMPGNAQSVPKEKIFDLERKFSDVEMKNNKLRANEIVNQNLMERMRSEYIRNILGMMTKMGVDFNDPASISKFLALFEEKDPDMFELFQESMNGLLAKDNIEAGEMPMEGMEEIPSQPGIAATTEQVPANGLMDKFKNLGQSMMMPRE